LISAVLVIIFLFLFDIGEQLIVADWMLFISNRITLNSTDLWRGDSSPYFAFL
jgi:hypothetical protein